MSPTDSVPSPSPLPVASYASRPMVHVGLVLPRPVRRRTTFASAKKMPSGHSPPFSFGELIAVIRFGNDLVPCGGATPLEQQQRRESRMHAVNDLLQASTHRVLAALQHKFPACFDDTQDAVQSANRTFLRQMKLGRFSFKGPADLVKLLVRVAYCKAARTYRENARAAGVNTAGDDWAEHEIDAILEPRETIPQINDAMRLELLEMLENLVAATAEYFVGDKPRRVVFEMWYAKKFEGLSVSQDEMAEASYMSTRTVRRYIEEIEDVWNDLLQEAKRQFEMEH